MAFLKMAYEIKTYKTRPDLEKAIIDDKHKPDFSATMKVDTAGDETFNLQLLFDATFIHDFNKRANSQEVFEVS
jgi:hypothetical protein